MLREIQWEQAIALASPYPYVLAVTLDKTGRPNAIGLGWWTYVSWSPPMVAIAVGRERYSHECLTHIPEFVLCFPSEEQANGAWLCGQVSGRDRDKLSECGFTTRPAKAVRPPLIEGATVCLECRVTQRISAGDHDLFIAEVVAIHGDLERKREKETPLLHRVPSPCCSLTR